MDAKERSREIWDEMAPGWERQNDFLWRTSEELARWMVDALDPSPGQTILDIAAGPGDTGFLAVERGAHLISTDFAAEMTAVAARAAEARGLENVECRQLDAEKMDLPDASVDGILCRWGYMLMQDPAAALRESKRVLRAGGKLVFSVWGPPAANPWVTIPVVVAVNRGLTAPADARAPGGMFSMADESGVRTMLDDARFEHIELSTFPISWRFDDFENLWSFYTELAGAVAALVKSAPTETVATFKDAVRAAADQYKTGSGYTIPGEVLNGIVW
jgi:ubiquinone/menaquinone biosynthesis C-methylase UbiE